MAAALDQDDVKAPWDRAVAKFGQYFTERGLDAADIPAAIIMHELLGMAMASAAWAVSFAAADLAGTLLPASPPS